ncbi:hypothetical protein AtubIFM56815_003104 [Aspergillus tubingensis]|uniref:Uncharacterized protein n=1 Tax=Aspergillus tubingensis TaxID=5068 RepID=A0A8H3SST7_ASPTU|nr:uncharacterized protein AtWU_05073 [Aspergillus tubingensis]GFN15272.1 hypothetical protein AtWU_05073 [Aspergillus tubingensis]GLA88645.1 hypothetical protein AtubIFM56815_003104 [Aspergillus tubingensis]GLA91886.1 hypothetical protein AtubIFM57143_006539 [Aspergillus tubingensis]
MSDEEGETLPPNAQDQYGQQVDTDKDAIPTEPDTRDGGSTTDGNSGQGTGQQIDNHPGDPNPIPDSSTEPGSRQDAPPKANVKQESFDIPPMTLKLNGYEELKKTLQATKGNTSNFSKTVNKLKQEKMELKTQNEVLMERNRTLEAYIKYLEEGIANTNAQLNEINSMMTGS